MILHPTHQCFTDAVDYLEYSVLQNRTNAKGFTLVHALCIAPCGTLFSHGWVETENVAIFAGLIDNERCYFMAGKEEFRRAYNVQKVLVYTINEMVKENSSSGHYGPWDEELSKHCNPKGEEAKTLSGSSEIHALPIGKLPVDKRIYQLGAILTGANEVEEIHQLVKERLSDAL